MTVKDFDKRLKEFIARVTKLNGEYMKDNFPSLKVDPIKTAPGLRYVKVIRGTSVYCFVDVFTGDVLKAASWKKPAKHARSNIFDEDFGMSGVTPYGAKYLI